MKSTNLKNHIINLDLYIAGASFAILVLVTFFGVIMRYCFHAPFTWQEEVQIGLFIWVTFFGGAACFRKKMHVSITSLYDILTPRGKLIDLVVVAAITISTLFYLFLKSLSMVAMFARTNKTTSVLFFPCAFLYGVVPLCCLLMIANYLVAVIPEIKELASNNKEQTK